MTELKHPIHHWLMLLKPGGVYDVPPPRRLPDSVQIQLNVMRGALVAHLKDVTG